MRLNVYLLKIMCLKPKLIKKSGKYKEDNYRGEAGSKYSIEVYADCCNCVQCTAKRANNWIVRNGYEAREHKRKCFITLTYAKQPFFLVRKDIQDFIKRFRFEINKEYYKARKKAKKQLNEEDFLTWEWEHRNEFIKTKIFYCGEYGTIHGRPHAHLIIYGWDDPKAFWIGLNKKINNIYESELINRVWGLGRTVYQDFGEHEAAYISLYNTPKEAFTKAYKMTREKLKQIEEIVHRKLEYYPKGQRVNLLNELKRLEKQFQDEKKQYLLIKEFNGWSLAMGWDGFFKEYIKTNKYTWEETFNDFTTATPSPWLKKLANKYGDIAAAEELFRREKEQYKSQDEIEEMQRNKVREGQKRKKEILDWVEGGRKNGEINAF